MSRNSFSIHRLLPFLKVPIVIALCAIISTEIVAQSWQKGELFLENGGRMHGEFIFNEVYPEGMVVFRPDGDTTQVQTWPAFKVRRLESERVTLKKEHLGYQRGIPNRAILVTLVYEGDFYEVLHRKIPFKATTVIPFLTGSTLWVAAIQSLKYKHLVYIREKSSQELRKLPTGGRHHSADQLNEFAFSLQGFVEATDAKAFRREMKNYYRNREMRGRSIEELIELIQVCEDLVARSEETSN